MKSERECLQFGGEDGNICGEGVEVLLRAVHHRAIAHALARARLPGGQTILRVSGAQLFGALALEAVGLQLRQPFATVSLRLLTSGVRSLQVGSLGEILRQPAQIAIADDRITTQVTINYLILILLSMLWQWK